MTVVRAPDEAGFTLVELLVAVTLLGFLTVLLFGGLRLGTRAWERSQENYASEHAMRAAQAVLAQNIAQAYPLRSARSGQTGLDFDGQAQVITWLSAARGTSGAMTRLRLAAQAAEDGFDLDLSTSDELATAPNVPARRLLAKVAALEISYLGRRTGEKTTRWASDWRGQQRLPSLIRIRIRMTDTRLVWPDLVVAPRIRGGANCMFDALTNDCS